MPRSQPIARERGETELICFVVEPAMANAGAELAPPAAAQLANFCRKSRTSVGTVVATFGTTQ